MRGAIEFLTGNSMEARTLRSHFVFKIVPMLNPDGVIQGNYRCSYAGCDLNRRFEGPSKLFHPTIYYTKKMVKDFSKDTPVVLYVDFHGHSRR